MTTNQIPPEKQFITSRLPWVVAAGGLILYLVTLSRWVTLSSLATFAQVSGLQWQPTLFHPLYSFLTLPLKLLPVAWVPVATHLFSAACGALTLALLARSVALLPHDRTHLQRMTEPSQRALLTIRAAWLPVVLAVLVGGLQFTFWERATTGGPEMLDLLLFAYVVRCLLEYRRDAREAWLFQAVVVYAVGMTENWLLVFLLPAFVASLVWFMGLSFFNSRFLGRAFLLSLAGMSLYLLLPLLAMFHPESPVGFWPGLKHLLVTQKNEIVSHWKYAQDRLAVVALPSLLPMFLIGLKFQTNYGDTSRLGMGFTKFCFHVLNAALLIFCGWVVLDPPFSASRLGLSAEFLPLHFLSVLGVGYFSGYFLLLFGERAKLTWLNRDLQYRVNRIVVNGVWLFAILVVCALLYRNWSLARGGGGSLLRDYAALLTRNLPAKPAILVSDDPRRTLLAQAALASQPDSPQHLIVDTRLLGAVDYHRTLNRQSDGLWPLPPTNQLKAVEHVTLIERMQAVATRRDVYYLHPSFGYYFELFHTIPHGIVYQLMPYGTNEVLAPPLSSDVVRENADFWSGTASELMARLIFQLRSSASKSPTNLLDRLMARISIAPSPPPDAFVLATFQSRALTYWGVQLQRLSQLEEAGRQFALAVELNPRNVVASVNLEFNRNLQAGSKTAVRLSNFIEDQFGVYRNWDQVIGENGPFDEPTFCYEQGRVFAQSTLYRQAVTEFERVRELVPDDLPSRLWLANVYLITRFYEQVLGVVAEVNTQPNLFTLTSTNRTDLLALESAAKFGQGRTAAAHVLLQSAISGDPTNYYLLAVTAQVYLRTGDYTNAVDLFTRQLRLQPNDPAAMMNKGYACLQLKAYEEAIPTLDRLLAIQPNNHPALMNRAIANLQAHHLDDAQRDYQRLADLYPDAYQVQFGLGEIAWQRRHTNIAIQCYEQYLATAPTNTTEARSVADRLRQLKSSSP